MRVLVLLIVTLPFIGAALLRPDRDPARASIPVQEQEEQEKSFLIDDFSKDDNTSALGTQWRMFTDRVMGGISDATFAFDTVDEKRCIRLKGNVSLANNGGFIQVALSLEKKGVSFDASRFRGIRIWGRGNGKTYAIHLRSKHTRLPWHYYGAKFVARAEWLQIDLPFEAFEPEYLQRKLDASSLSRIAIVAIGEEFEADVAVSRLEFY